MIRGTIGYRAGLGGDVFEGFAASFIGAWGQLTLEKGHEFHFLRGLGCMLHDTANQMARNFRGSWVLMCDTDHVFGTDAFVQMVETFEENDLDILSGFMQSRTPPYHPILFKTDFDPLRGSTPIRPSKDKEDQYSLIEFDAGGCGSLMVHRRVFERIAKMDELPFDFRSKFNPPQYFEPMPGGIWTGASEGFKLPEGRRMDEFYWEDWSFFWRAKLLGFKAYCAPWIKFYHVEKRLVTDNLIGSCDQGQETDSLLSLTIPKDSN